MELENKSQEPLLQSRELRNNSLLRKIGFRSETLGKAILCFYKREVERRGNTFVMSNEVAENLSNFVCMLTDYSNIYGVMLSGTLGNGKTTAVKAFFEACNYLAIKGRWPFEFYRVKMINAIDLVSLFSDNKEKFNEYANSDILIIDDLGSEPTDINLYGAKFSPIAKVIYDRYELIKFTIITTNMPDNDLKEYYPERLNDRLIEMFPPDKRIIFVDNSYRQSNGK